MRGIVALTGTAIVALAAASLLPDALPGTPDPDPDPVGVQAAAAGLEAFDACDTLVEHLQAQAVRHPWGGSMGMAVGGMAVDDMAADGAEAARAPVPQASATQGTSDTNVQVAGVDEPDLVETDGRRLYVVFDGRLRVVDVAGEVPRLVAEVDLGLPGGSDGELLLHEGRLLVATRGWNDLGLRSDGARGPVDLPMGTAVTTIVLLDVAGDQPREVARTELEGELVAGRGIDGTAHLVVAHHPQPLPAIAMEAVWGAPTEAAATRELQRALAPTSAEDWLPVMRHVDASGTVTTGRSVACEDVVRPTGTDDGGMLELLTLDTHGDDALPEATTALLTDAQTVTATADQLVVATPVWPAFDQPAAGAPAPAVEMVAPATGSTRLHLFDLGPRGTTHRASGEVPGMLLNQFSMSLADDLLRVATTAGQPFDGSSESVVSVLRPSGDRLDVVGSVGGLGRGETIHSVRFLGDRAYVVTFRQTDPLYTIDLSDPTAPRVAGELKITGYSAYLHPLDGERLLGIGQEATAQGQVTGMQVSVFDVSDPAAPSRLSQVVLPGAGTEAEWDHHAVLVHDGLVVLPYERWSGPTAGPSRGSRGRGGGARARGRTGPHARHGRQHGGTGRRPLDGRGATGARGGRAPGHRGAGRGRDPRPGHVADDGQPGPVTQPQIWPSSRAFFSANSSSVRTPSRCSAASDSSWATGSRGVPPAPVPCRARARASRAR